MKLNDTKPQIRKNGHSLRTITACVRICIFCAIIPFLGKFSYYAHAFYNNALSSQNSYTDIPEATITKFLDGKYLLSWSAVENADLYILIVNGKTLNENISGTQFNVTSILSLGNSYIFEIYAVVKGVSSICAYLHYTQLIQLEWLDKPVFTQNILSWENVKNATSYSVIINNITILTTQETSVDLSNYIYYGGNYTIAVICKNSSAYYTEATSLPITVKIGQTVSPPLNGEVAYIGSRFIASWVGENVSYSVLSKTAAEELLLSGDFTSVSFIKASTNFADITDFISSSGDYALLLETVIGSYKSGVAVFVFETDGFALGGIDG